MKKWELLQVMVPAFFRGEEWQRANKLAAEGWELVSVIYLPADLTPAAYVLFFKREIIED